MPEAIHLSLTHSPGPGAQWQYDVQFLESDIGYRTLVLDGDSGRMRVVRRSRRTLTWREAFSCILATDSTWLFIDSYESVDVLGVPEWQADMLRLAACREEREPLVQGILLARLSDEAISRFATLWGRLVSPRSMKISGHLSDIHSDTGAGSVIERLVLAATESDARAPARWLKRVRGACCAKPGPGPSMKDVAAIRDADSLMKLVGGPLARDADVRAALFQRWVDLMLPNGTRPDRWCLIEQPKLLALERIVAATRTPGEIDHAAQMDPGLRQSLERFEFAVSEFIKYVSESPPATSYAGGIGQGMARQAAARAAEFRKRICGEFPGG